MTFTFLHATNQGAPVLVPQIGLEMLVRVPPEATGGVLTVIETTNAPGWSELLDRHAHRGDLLGYRGAMIQDLDLDLDARAFPQTMTQNCDLVVISASLGGTRASNQLASELTVDFSTGAPARLLDALTRLVTGASAPR